VNDKVVFDNFIAVANLVSLDGSIATISVPSKFAKEIIVHKYLELIDHELAKITETNYKCVVKEENELNVPVKGQFWGDDFNESPLETTNLNPQYTFDSYVVGAYNKECYSAALTAATEPGKFYNPLFIYGPSGCGKTHLVNAIGLKIKELHPELRVLYVSAHLFMVQYVDAKLNNKINQFIQFYQTIDVLIIDDIQELSNKEKTQNTFFHIFNHLHMNGKQIILTADRPPVSIIGLEDRLLTRFKWGLQAEIEKPTKSLRYSILTNKVNKDGLLIPEDVISFIAENVNESIRVLEGFINALLANSIVHRCDINMALVNKILRQFTNNSMKEISFEDIKEVICEHYHVSVEDLCSRSRKRPIANIRQVAIFLADKYTELSTVQIGKQIGGRNHATVIHSVNQIRNLMDIDAKFRNEVDLIETKIKGRSK
jgi:chromosomal replication initiator protein